MQKESFFIIGLGNPGVDYRGTRHNFGFLMVDSLAENSASISSFQFKKNIQAEIALGSLAGKSVCLVKPQTFMNNSGIPVRALLGNYGKIDYQRIVVVYDDLDLTLGRIKLQRGGGSGGHNGLKSLISELGTEDFLRMRFGICSESRENDTVDFVLGQFSAEELQIVQEMKDKFTAGVALFLKSGMDAAMNQLNRKVKVEIKS